MSSMIQVAFLKCSEKKIKNGISIVDQKHRIPQRDIPQLNFEIVYNIETQIRSHHTSKPTCSARIHEISLLN